MYQNEGAKSASYSQPFIYILNQPAALQYTWKVYLVATLSDSL